MVLALPARALALPLIGAPHPTETALGATTGGAPWAQAMGAVQPQPATEMRPGLLSFPSAVAVTELWFSCGAWSP